MRQILPESYIGAFWTYVRSWFLKYKYPSKDRPFARSKTIVFETPLLALRLVSPASIRKMFYLKSLSVGILLASTTASAYSALGRPQNTTGLNPTFVADDKVYWGTCADPKTLSESQNVKIIKANFGQVTPENSMKWDATQRALFFAPLSRTMYVY